MENNKIILFDIGFRLIKKELDENEKRRIFGNENSFHEFIIANEETKKEAMKIIFEKNCNLFGLQKDDFQKCEIDIFQSIISIERSEIPLSDDEIITDTENSNYKTLKICIEKEFVENETLNNEEIIILTRNRVEEEITTCENCGDRHLRNDGYYSEWDDNYSFCTDGCRDEWENDHYDDYHDEYDNNSSDWELNTNTFTTDYRSKSKNAVPFGIELEFYIPNYISILDLSNDLNEKLNGFGLKNDGSLGRNGYEIVSPIISGRKGIQAIKTLTDILTKYQARVDRTCGFHLHISGDDLIQETKHLKKLLELYYSFEEVLLSFLPKSRRENNYCKKITDNYSELDLIINNSMLDEFEKAYYKTTSDDEIREKKSCHYQNERYYGLNLHSLFSNRHYEIRYHSGTINYEKIINWIKLHLQMKKIATSDEFNFAELRTKVKEIDFIRKTDEMFQLLKLPKTIKRYYKRRQRLFSKNRELVEIN